jgi:peptidyl-prolyl cis-trans isomerase A (cyclophilin A)
MDFIDGRRTLGGSLGLGLTLLAMMACGKTPEPPPPPPPAPPPAAATASPSASNASTTTTTAAAPTANLVDGDAGLVQHGGPDPLDGKWAMADALKGLKGTGPVTATIDTSNGSLTCKLYDTKAPNTVANFIGLARGTRPWKDPHGNWVKRPAYDGTTFHRIIKGFMIQGGDPVGNGTGEPGYTIKDELWPGAKHDRAGLLCMANRGHDTNGQQFFITDAAAAHLDGNYTIFGECAPEDTIHAIASVPLKGEKPTTPVVINDVTIARGAGPAK